VLQIAFWFHHQQIAFALGNQFNNFTGNFTGNVNY
jgi:hypothetical protein